MANQTQFDLKKEIALWRQNLWLSGNFNTQELDELESHLHDEIDCEVFASLPDEEKFVLAKHKIGSDKTLSKAYGRKRILNFTQASWIAQASMCLFIFLIFSRAALFALGDINLALQINDNLVGMTLLFSFQIIGGLFSYLLFRRVANISKEGNQLYRANGIVIITTLIVTGLFIFYSKVTFMGFVFKGPLVLSALPMTIFVICFLWFVIVNFRFWRKERTKPVMI